MTSSDARFPYSSSSLHPPRALAYLSLAAQFGSLAAVGALAFEPLAQACDAIAPSLDLLTLVGWLGGAAATLRLAELLWAPGGTPLLLQRFESARVEAAPTPARIPALTAPAPMALRADDGEREHGGTTVGDTGVEERTAERMQQAAADAMAATARGFDAAGPA